MVKKNNGKAEIDLGGDLMKKMEAITETRGVTREERPGTFIQDYTVVGLANNMEALI